MNNEGKTTLVFSDFLASVCNEETFSLRAGITIFYGYYNLHCFVNMIYEVRFKTKTIYFCCFLELRKLFTRFVKKYIV